MAALGKASRMSGVYASKNVSAWTSRTRNAVIVRSVAPVASEATAMARSPGSRPRPLSRARIWSDTLCGNSTNWSPV